MIIDSEIFSRTRAAREYIVGFPTHSNLTKSSTFINNNKVKHVVTIGWRTDFSETFTALNENNETETRFVPQQKGIFYDLLPLGGEVDTGTIEVFANETALRDSQYDFELVNNYKGSGRTLLIVRIKHSTDTSYSLRYSTVHGWYGFVDYGNYIRNSVSYETGNKTVSQGYPDDGGEIIDAQWMKDLDSETDDRKFVYSEMTVFYDFLLAVNSGLNKKVRASEDSMYTKSAIVHQDQIYSYYLRYANDYSARSKNIILFDNLESYAKPEGDVNGQWKGTFRSVDLSQMSYLGADPVVYLSSDYVDPSFMTPEDLRNSQVWKRIDLFGDVSEAKAIAIDVSKRIGGGEFVLEASQAVAAVIYMKAPSTEPDVAVPEGQISHQTYNNAYSSSRLTNIYDEDFVEDRLIS